MARVIKIPDFEKAVSEILNDYAADVTQKTKEAIDAVGKVAVAETKAEAPYRPASRKHYRSGWRKDRVSETPLTKEIVVHNKTGYRIAHLLENGHACRGGGRVKGIPHIKPAEENAVKNLTEAVKKIAGGN